MRAAGATTSAVSRRCAAMMFGRPKPPQVSFLLRGKRDAADTHVGIPSRRRDSVV
jgi:hypothetical protein